MGKLLSMFAETNPDEIISALMEQNHLDRGLKKIMEFSSFFNQYFQHSLFIDVVAQEDLENMVML